MYIYLQTGHVGAGTLPRIIGGSDLEAHIPSRSKEIDDWFREAAEVSSHGNQVVIGQCMSASEVRKYMIGSDHLCPKINIILI